MVKKRERKEYFKKYYMEHREEIKYRALQRYYRKKAEQQQQGETDEV